MIKKYTHTSAIKHTKRLVLSAKRKLPMTIKLAATPPGTMSNLKNLRAFFWKVVFEFLEKSSFKIKIHFSVYKTCVITTKRNYPEFSSTQKLAVHQLGSTANNRKATTGGGFACKALPPSINKPRLCGGEGFFIFCCFVVFFCSRIMVITSLPRWLFQLKRSWSGRCVASGRLWPMERTRGITFRVREKKDVTKPLLWLGTWISKTYSDLINVQLVTGP